MLLLAAMMMMLRLLILVLVLMLELVPRRRCCSCCEEGEEGGGGGYRLRKRSHARKLLLSRALVLEKRDCGRRGGRVERLLVQRREQSVELGAQRIHVQRLLLAAVNAAVSVNVSETATVSVSETLINGVAEARR